LVDKIIMAEETEIIFREEQRFSLWLRVVLVFSMALTVGFSIMPLTKIPAEQWRGNIGEIILLFIVGLFLPIGIAVRGKRE
jgi:hypothetical protein